MNIATKMNIFWDIQWYKKWRDSSYSNKLDKVTNCKKDSCHVCSTLKINPLPNAKLSNPQQNWNHRCKSNKTEKLRSIRENPQKKINTES